MSKIEIPNLDCYVDASEAEAFASSLGRPRSMRLRLAQDYATLKARAMRAREAGQITLAMSIEDQCETIYNRLPEADRW